MSWDGFSPSRNDIPVDVMPATVTNKYNRMLVSQQPNEIKSLHA